MSLWFPACARVQMISRAFWGSTRTTNSWIHWRVNNGLPPPSKSSQGCPVAPSVSNSTSVCVCACKRRWPHVVIFPPWAGRSRGAILSQYYSRTMQLCRRKQSLRPSVRSFSRSARPSICGYRIETDATNFDRDGKRSRCSVNIQNQRFKTFTFQNSTLLN